jgi:outer membrane protein TolC
MSILSRSFVTFVVCALGALLAPRAAFALQPLDEFITAASNQGFDARESRATSAQREAESDAAFGRLLPAFSARGTYTHNQYESAATIPLVGGGSARVVLTPQNQLDGVLQLDVPIVGLSDYHRYRASQASARSARAQTEMTRLEVGRSVAQAYFSLLGAAGLQRAAAQSLKAAEDNLRTVEIRLGAGLGTELDRARAAGNVERARRDQADAELAIALGSRRLETLSGLTATAAGGLAPDTLAPEAPLDQYLALAGKTPSERAAREAAAAAEQSKKSAQTAFVPTLAAMGQERFTNATGFAGESPSYLIQLTAAIRLDYATFANDDAQSAALDAQRVRTDRQRRAVADAIFEAYRRVEAGIAKSRSARAEVVTANRAADLARERYLAGAATQLDVTQAQRDLFLAEASRVQADADLAFARASLRIAAGLPVAAKRTQ